MQAKYAWMRWQEFHIWGENIASTTNAADDDDYNGATHTIQSALYTDGRIRYNPTAYFQQPLMRSLTVINNLLIDQFKCSRKIGQMQPGKQCSLRKCAVTVECKRQKLLIQSFTLFFVWVYIRVCICTAWAHANAFECIWCQVIRVEIQCNIVFINSHNVHIIGCDSTGAAFIRWILNWKLTEMDFWEMTQLHLAFLHKHRDHFHSVICVQIPVHEVHRIYFLCGLQIFTMRWAFNSIFECRWGIQFSVKQKHWQRRPWTRRVDSQLYSFLFVNFFIRYFAIIWQPVTVAPGRHLATVKRQIKCTHFD